MRMMTWRTMTCRAMTCRAKTWCDDGGLVPRHRPRPCQVTEDGGEEGDHSQAPGAYTRPLLGST